MIKELLRFELFLGLFFLLCVWEIKYPRRNSSTEKKTRWFSNISLIILGNFFIKVLFPLTLIQGASQAHNLGFGLFNSISLTYEIKIICSIILLDLAIYYQHILFHKIPLLWRLHRVHHTDTEFDITTGLRFHPIEIILSMLIKITLIFLLGIPPFAVLCFEILLNATSMFNHGNISIPLKVESIIRFFIVTPDMHRVHHSTHSNEINKNFGFNLSCWDKIFKTYLRNPKDGHGSMKIGMAVFRKKKDNTLFRLLILPFLKL